MASGSARKPADWSRPEASCWQPTSRGDTAINKLSGAGREHFERRVWHELKGARRELVQRNRSGASPQKPLVNQPTGTVSKPAGSGLKCGPLPAAARKEMNMETLIALMLCVDPMWHQSRHLSSATRRCVTRCITFVMALVVASPTQMESKTCTCCKHESTYWKSLPPLVFSDVQSVHAAVPSRENNPSRCAFCKVSAALRCYISKAMYKSLA